MTAILQAADVVGEPRADRAPDRGARPPAGRGARPGPIRKTPSEDDPDRVNTRRLEDAFRGALGTKVALTRGRKGGRLVISFFSDEELHTIYERIVGGD